MNQTAIAQCFLSVLQLKQPLVHDVFSADTERIKRLDPTLIVLV